jgi:hypothetical protein
MESKHYYRIRLPALAAALLCLPLSFAQSSALLKVEPVAKVAAKRNTTVEARIGVSLQPGYHVNSNTPREAYLIPLRLTWTPGALEPVEVIYPKPHMEKYQFSPKPLSVFTGDFHVAAKFKVPATTPGGPGIMFGKLRYQACNDKACFPPKTVEVQVPYSVR